MVLLSLSAPSLAQSRPAETGAAQNAVGVADIIVTAQRREERNQDVPISITAFSTERLEQQNIATGQDLNGLVPSLQVSSQGQASRDVEAFALRGQAPTYQGAAAVVTYLNEVPLPQAFTSSQQGGPGNFVDLENVQVLAGPQGTLFGRNTTGGAVLLVPRKPTNDFGGYIEASVGNYDYRGVEGVINIPIIEDKLLIRASGTFQDRDGFTQDIVWNKDRDDLHYYAGRIGITIKPTEWLENYTLIYGSHSHNNGAGYVHRGFNLPVLAAFQQCVSPCTEYARQTEIGNQLGARTVRHGLDDFERLTTGGVINKTSIQLNDELTINNIVSYQRYRKNYDYDADGSVAQVVDVGSNRFPDFPVQGLNDEFAIPPYRNFPEDLPRDNTRQITEEFQLQGSMLDKHLNFTVGAFYYDQKPVSQQLESTISFCPLAFNGFCGPGFKLSDVHSISRALYAQATLNLGAVSPSLEGVNLTGGYRYTWDKITGSSIYYTQTGPGAVNCLSGNFPGTQPEDCRYSAVLKSDAPTWLVGVDYKPVSGLMLFGKVSRGYKAGGFNAGSVRVETRTFDPEYVTNYEVGFKSDWRVGNVPFRLNMTGYSMDYKDIQRIVGDFNLDTGAAGSRNIQASARIRGIEAEATFRPVPGLEIGGNASYTDGKWKSLNIPAPSGGTGCDGPVAPGGALDLTCTDFGASKWIYSVHASLDLPVPESVGQINLFANYSYVSKQDFTLRPDGLQFEQPGSLIQPFGLLNLSAKWKNIAQSNFDVDIFVNNATNKLYQISNTNVFPFGYWAELYGSPRMYGMRLRYRFGS